jgi:hypothetical protein
MSMALCGKHVQCILFPSHPSASPKPVWRFENCSERLTDQELVCFVVHIVNYTENNLKGPKRIYEKMDLF